MREIAPNTGSDLAPWDQREMERKSCHMIVTIIQLHSVFLFFHLPLVKEINETRERHLIVFLLHEKSNCVHPEGKKQVDVSDTHNN